MIYTSNKNSALHHATLCEANQKVDDVVLIENENYKRPDWRIGRINKLFYGRDNKVRSAEIIVITNGKQMPMRRPINKLYPIENESFPDTDEIPITVVNDENIPQIGVGGVFD